MRANDIAHDFKAGLNRCQKPWRPENKQGAGRPPVIICQAMSGASTPRQRAILAILRPDKRQIADVYPTVPIEIGLDD